MPRTPMFVAGYYMDFPTTRRVMAALNISDRGAPDDYLEFPINDWFAQHLDTDLGGTIVLAGAIPELPNVNGQETGMLLMTQFLQMPRERLVVEKVRELPSSKAVREWLVERSGIKPTRNETKGPSPRLIVTGEMMDGWRRTKSDEPGLTLSKYLEREVKARRIQLTHGALDPAWYDSP
ncbi:hypothetical protein B0H12DRAFT_1242639 [Mycena haematopus]|nr:hypothetical protein B0H12DRAFT_1242639 [Mycena haematopus]